MIDWFMCEMWHAWVIHSFIHSFIDWFMLGLGLGLGCVWCGTRFKLMLARFEFVFVLKALAKHSHEPAPPFCADIVKGEAPRPQSI